MIRILLGAALAVSGTAAQADMIAASDPEGIAKAMKTAGYKAELGVDSVGDPMITTELSGWSARVLFYDCRKETNDDCQSVQLSTGFDLKQPMDPAHALEVSDGFRFVAVSLDEEGDPYLRWDILTGEGISTGVFLTSLRRYAAAIDDAAQVIFRDERQLAELEKAAAEEAPAEAEDAMSED